MLLWTFELSVSISDISFFDQEIYINSCATHAQKICKRLSDHDYVLPSCKSHFSKHKLSPKTKGPRGEFNGILPKDSNSKNRGGKNQTNNKVLIP